MVFSKLDRAGVLGASELQLLGRVYEANLRAGEILSIYHSGVRDEKELIDRVRAR